MSFSASIRGVRRGHNIKELRALDAERYRGGMRKQDWIIIIAVVAFLVIISVVMKFGSVTERGVINTKPFRAQSGKMRDNVMPMVSKTQEEFSDVQVETPTENPPEEDDTEQPLNITVHESVIAEAAQLALDNPIPEDGINDIEKRLAEQHDSAEESDMNQALAMLRLRVIPAQADKAEEAAKKAAETARTPEERLRAVFVEATIQQFRGDNEEARKRIQEALARDPETTLPSLKLRLLDASLAAQTGDVNGAMEACRRVMAQSSEVAPEAQAAARDSYRLAALKLTRLLRGQGRTVEADELAEAVKKQLSPSNESLP